MRLSAQIEATGVVPRTLRRYGCSETEPKKAAAWLRKHPELDHEVLPPLKERLKTLATPLEREVQKALREVRLEQEKFRERVGRAYGWKCAVTGCAQPECLEAAHLMSEGGWRQHNEARHGVLLRADLHRLMDAGLMRISDDYTVRISAKVKDAALRELDGAGLRLPKRRADYPSVGQGATNRARSEAVKPRT